ncbi:hypothetical protein GCM10011575_08250 [Microlunatus endophyticus]|uniref:Poly-beta-1,6-N-acetyl-D-glucosamine biosynthesis protein PgaD n=1 Tax=Microlunatus endophyticus TaxID=1716077 RepID=A0A917S294_9ACTN|nr:hypothetical protein [Microlunatus endophyticus]GGL52288.1 hypothetical protein GCM10011575_08250 [Microlunatus endophyticus]
MEGTQPGRPAYIVNTVDENEVTVDWFFGPGHHGKTAVQGALIVVGWFFDILPIVITVHAITYRYHETRGWWSYEEGFLMWDITLLILAVLVIVFIVGFLLLHYRNRAIARQRLAMAGYHEEHLAQRLEVAQALYARKFGPADLRLHQNKIRIEPYSDLETYELRDQYRAYGVE